MLCLDECLYRLTGCKKWKYDKKKLHQWKIDLHHQGFERGRSINYHDKLDTIQKIAYRKYIQIYNTKRETTHAVIVNYTGDILYNPNDVSDCTTKGGIITLTNLSLI